MFGVLRTGTGLLAILALLALAVTFAITLKPKGWKVALISAAVVFIVAALLYIAAIFMIMS